MRKARGIVLWPFFASCSPKPLVNPKLAAEMVVSESGLKVEMGWLIKWIVPHIRVADLPTMLALTFVGAGLAGLFGIVHDLVTFAISPEYFTKMKFDQFRYADFGFGDRVFAGTIGFLASWWVGAFAAWFLARRLIPAQPPRQAVGQVLLGFLCVFVLTLLCGVCGYLIGIVSGPHADYSSWDEMLRFLDIEHEWAFIRVAYIHTGSYVGGLLGLLFALTLIHPHNASHAKHGDLAKSVPD